MREALYVVEFGDVSVPGTYRNGGVAVLETGRVFGGDSGFYYLGEFQSTNGTVTATIDVTQHNPLIQNAWGNGATNFKLQMRGEVQGQNLVGTMTLAGSSLSLPIRLSWKADLPNPR
jgi:hypothetical protein